MKPSLARAFAGIGPDGALVAACAALVVVYALVRGADVWGWVGLVLTLDAAWFLLRGRGAPAEPPPP